MREIKFDYIFKERFSGKLIHRIFTIEELENLEMDILLSENYWEIVARRQFTGLRDKNGKEIFESDIVKTDDKIIGYIVFQNGAFHWTDGAGHWDMEKCTEKTIKKCLWAEVIGNIYENPELNN
jgi:uncharacterized phage protein (TIGR01671 family)